VTISSNGATLVSRNLFDRDAWQAFRPDTFVSAQHDGRYIFTYTAKSGARDTVIFDLTGETPFITRADPIADAMFFEVGAGKLYFRTGRSITEWDASDRPPMNMTWRSKQLLATGDMTFGALLTEGSAYAAPATDGSLPVASISDGVIVSGPFAEVDDDGIGVQAPPAPQPLRTRIVADGTVIRESTRINLVDRLPGKLARMWEIEVAGGVEEVTALSLAASPSELSASGGR
jgi:hypothetical protein